MADPMRGVGGPGAPWTLRLLVQTVHAAMLAKGYEEEYRRVFRPIEALATLCSVDADARAALDGYIEHKRMRVRVDREERELEADERKVAD